MIKIAANSLTFIAIRVKIKKDIENLTNRLKIRAIQSEKVQQIISYQKYPRHVSFYSFCFYVSKHSSFLVFLIQQK